MTDLVPSYLLINPGLQIAGTVQVNDHLLVDVAADGRVVGMEDLTGPIDRDMFDVLRALPFKV